MHTYQSPQLSKGKELYHSHTLMGCYPINYKEKGSFSILNQRHEILVPIPCGMCIRRKHFIRLFSTPRAKHLLFYISLLT